MAWLVSSFKKIILLAFVRIDVLGSGEQERSSRQEDQLGAYYNSLQIEVGPGWTGTGGRRSFYLSFWTLLNTFCSGRASLESEKYHLSFCATSVPASATAPSLTEFNLSFCLVHKHVNSYLINLYILG